MYKDEINKYQVLSIRRQLIVCVVKIARSLPCLSSPLGGYSGIGEWILSNDSTPIYILRVPNEVSDATVVALKRCLTFFWTDDKRGRGDGQRSICSP
jgi:hypothetical protein